MLANEPGNQASTYFIARQDIDGYNTDIGSRGAILEAYYFANLYSNRPAGHAMLRDSLMHLSHHRGQLTVYLRMNDVPVPAIYGPSADDPRF